MLNIGAAHTKCPLQPNIEGGNAENFKGHCYVQLWRNVNVATTVRTYLRCGFLWTKVCSKEKTIYKTVRQSYQKKKEYNGIRCIKDYYLDGKRCVPSCKDIGCELKQGDCIAPGKCSCHKGFEGIDCKSACEEGKYGKYCKNQCTCKNSAHCDKATGKCTCKPGFNGTYCANPCIDSYGQDCKHPVTCIKNQTQYVDPINGTCTCKRGFKGKNCKIPCPEGTFDQFCERDCNCLNNATCSPIDGTCYCAAGWQGKRCSLVCDNWEYGDRCNTQCVCKITQTKDCDHVDGTCHCLPGFKGKRCEDTCNEWEFGAGCLKSCTCERNTTRSCNSKTGMCNCTLGFNGANCENECGLNSTNSCVKKCNCTKYGTCEVNTGMCLCEPGYYGDRCQFVCEAGYFGRNCESKCLCEQNSTCSRIDGTCACKPGWMGKTCNQKCIEGFYGENCLEECTCGPYGRCERVTGACSCFGEYQGTNCTKKCENWTYGEGCTQQCHCDKNNTISCHAMKGDCECKVGWLPLQNCSVKQDCKGTHYGKNCSNVCFCKNGICDSSDGRCTCNKGWRGKHCQEKCPAGYFGKDCESRCDCSRHGKCDHVTGECDCNEGYYGDKCDKCPPNKYGKNCKEKCKCQNGGYCNNVHGTCHCKQPGYRGEFCEKRCGNWTFGYDCESICNCVTNNTESCDHVSGRCYCRSGFHQITCSDICEYGKYGPGCEQKCRCDPLGSNRTDYCDPQTGKCTCKPGFMGQDCSKPCGPGKFGDGCIPCECPLRSMTGDCDKFNGSCECSTGFRGTYCNETCSLGYYGNNCFQYCGGCADCHHKYGCQERQVSTVPLRTIVIGGGGAFIAILLLVVIIILYKRRTKDKKSLSSLNNDTGMDSAYEMQDKNLYEDPLKHIDGPNPIYDDALHPNLQNPIYSSALHDNSNGYDKLHKHNKQQNFSKPSPETYSKLGPSIESRQVIDSRHSNVQANLIYGSVDQQVSDITGYVNTSFDYTCYDSLEHQKKPSQTNGVEVYPCYDHLGITNKQISEDYAVVNKNSKPNGKNVTSNPVYASPNAQDQYPNNSTEYDSLNRGDVNKSHDNVILNDVYDSLRGQASNQKSFTINETYDALHMTTQPRYNNATTNDTNDSLKHGNTRNESNDSLHQKPQQSTSQATDAYDSLDQDQQRNNTGDMYDSLQQIVQHDCNNVTINENYDTLNTSTQHHNDNNYNSLHEVIDVGGKQGQPRGSSFGRAKDYNKLDDEYAVPDVMNKEFEATKKMNDEKKKKKKGRKRYSSINQNDD